MFILRALSRSVAPGLLILTFMLSSCSARIDATLRADGSADAAVSASIAPRTAALIRNLSGLSAASASGPVLDAVVLSRSLRTSTAMKTVALRNVDDRTVSGSLSITDFGLLAQDSLPEGSRPFVRFDRALGRIHIHLDRGSAATVIAALSPEIVDYLEALMAPAASGEDLTKEAYLDLVASVYGDPVSAEIAAAVLVLSLRLPLPATSAAGGKIVRGTAEFSIPLADLLVLEKPLDLTAGWK